MKLFKRPKPRIERRFGPIDYIQPTIEGFKVPTPPPFPPKSKPSQLLQDLRGVMPEPPIQDYEHFMDTNLYDGMVKQSRRGENYLTIDCGSKLDEILLDEFGTWEAWIRDQGIKTELYKGCDDDKAILLYWGEDQCI